MADFDPAFIQAPGWVEEYGHDLPIFPEKAKVHDKLQEVLDAAPLGSDNALVLDRIGINETQIPIYSKPTSGESSSNTHRSWLGALLMALFNVPSFLTFIEEAVDDNACNDPVIIGLLSMANTFHRLSNDPPDDEELEDEIWSRLETFWHCIMTPGPNGTDRFWPGYCQVPEFLNYLFKRLEIALLRQDVTGNNDDVILSTRFMQLFKHFTVRFTPMRRGSASPVLRRRATAYPQSDGFILAVHVPEGMTLGDAISQAMREIRTEGTSPEDGDEVEVVDFHKFAYLPEVFFISPMFLSKHDDDDDDSRYTSDEEFIYPERLDMSALTDDPDRPGDDTDRIYKLQSIVTCSDQTLDWTTRYKAALRVNEDKWVQYGYDTPSQAPSFTTLEEISDPAKRETAEEAPNLLVYVRDHNVEDSGILPDTVKPQESTIDANTQVLDEYGLESSDLARFIEAQNQLVENEDGKLDNMIAIAKSELLKGRKTSHWMWYMFPQVLMDRASRLGKLFAIKNVAEAIAYWDNSLLRSRYKKLMQAMMDSPQDDIREMFGEVDALKLQASLTLFMFVCDEDERFPFVSIFTKFALHTHQETVGRLIQWLDDAGEQEAIEWIVQHAGPDSGYQLPVEDTGDEDDIQSQAQSQIPDFGSLRMHITNTETLKYKNSGYGSGSLGFAAIGRNILFELMRLGETEVDDSGEDPIRVAEYNQRATLLGKVLIGFDYTRSHGETEHTPESLEHARLIGRNLLLLSKPDVEPHEEPRVEPHEEPRVEPYVNPPYDVDYVYDSDGSESLVIDDPSVPGFHNRHPDHVDPNTGGADRDDPDISDSDDDLARDIIDPDNTSAPEDGFTPDNGSKAGGVNPPANGFGLDGTSESLSEGSDLNEEDPYEAVAIPADPEDPRIKACQSWRLNRLIAELQKEQMDRAGLRCDPEKHRARFLKHFELERDYNIYHASRLRQAVEDRGIVMTNGEIPTFKMDMVDALTEYDTQKLDKMQFVDDGAETETDSVGSGAEAYQSSETTTGSKKRARDDFEEWSEDDIIDEEVAYGDEDYRDVDVKKKPAKRRVGYCPG